MGTIKKTWGNTSVSFSRPTIPSSKTNTRTWGGVTVNKTPQEKTTTQEIPQTKEPQTKEQLESKQYVSRESLTGKRISGSGVTNSPLNVSVMPNQITYTETYPDRTVTRTVTATPIETTTNPNPNIATRIERGFSTYVTKPIVNFIEPYVPEGKTKDWLFTPRKQTTGLTDTGKFIFFGPAMTTSGVVGNQYQTQINQMDPGLTQTTSTTRVTEPNRYESQVITERGDKQVGSTVKGFFSDSADDNLQLARYKTYQDNKIYQGSIGGTTTKTGPAGYVAGYNNQFVEAGVKGTGYVNEAIVQPTSVTTKYNFFGYGINTNQKVSSDIITQTSTGVAYPTNTGTVFIGSTSPSSNNINLGSKIITSGTSGGTTSQTYQFVSPSLTQNVMRDLTGLANFQNRLLQDTRAVTTITPGLISSPTTQLEYSQTTTENKYKLDLKTDTTPRYSNIQDTPQDLFTQPVFKFDTPTTQKDKPKINSGGGGTILRTDTETKQIIIPTTITTPTTTQTTGLKFTSSSFGTTITPGGFNINKDTTKIIPPPLFIPAGFTSNPYSRVLKGGKVKTGYTPSFSALVFNIRGKKPKRAINTGIGFRPITPNFEFIKRKKLRGLKLRL